MSEWWKPLFIFNRLNHIMKKTTNAPETPVITTEKSTPVKAIKKTTAKPVATEVAKTSPEPSVAATKTKPEEIVAAPETPVPTAENSTPAKATKNTTPKSVSAEVTKTTPEPSVTLEATKTKPKETVAAEVTKVAPAVEPEKVKPEPSAASPKIAMHERVGLTAGAIWHYLAEHGATPVAKLVNELPEEEAIIQRSIGWLAQEDKITLSGGDQVETIVLKDSF